MIDKYIVMITATVTSLTILAGALVKFRKELSELFKGIFKRKKQGNSIQLNINNHQLNNIVMEIEDGVEKRVLNTVNSKKEKRQAIETRYEILTKEIVLTVSNYIDQMEKTLYQLSRTQMKNISRNAIILALEASKLKANERLELNHFETVENWTVYIDDLSNYLFNVYANDFYNRTSMEQFSEKYKDIISECEKIFKKHVQEGFNRALQITKESIVLNELYKAERREMIDKIIRENSN